ncbi:MAG: LAGLIDADG family homing endonuclease, partial [archaeon]
FAGDGWISRGNSGYSLFITGNPKDEREYYLRIKYLFLKKFGLTVKPREFPYWKTYGVSVTNQAIIRRFMSVGMPSGKKASIVKVPDFIQKNARYFTPFIRGVFDTDGSIYFEKSYNKNASKWQKTHHHMPVVSFVTTSECLSISLFGMLASLGFNFSRKKRAPAKIGKFPSYRLRLKGKANVHMFFDDIRPENTRHLSKFKMWLEEGFY